MENIQEWAEKVITTFTPFAEEVNLSFYPLQSAYKQNPKILFMGLNPGGGHPYTCQKANPAWEFNEKGMMTPDRLLKGNPSFDLIADKWHYVKGLESIPYFKTALEKGDFCLMNYYYLATKNFIEVTADPRQKAMLISSKSLTYDFIDLVRPELIVVLGTANGIDKLDFNGNKPILHGTTQRLLVESNYKNIPVLAIPHPSMMMLTAPEINAVDMNIREIINGEVLTNFDFHTTRIYKKPGLASLVNYLELNELKFIQHSEEIYDLFLQGIGADHLKLRIVVNKNNQYWALRSSKADKVNWYDKIDYGESYRDAIKDNKEYMKNSWVIRKEFKNYGANNEIDLQTMIAEDFRSLVSAIDNANNTDDE